MKQFLTEIISNKALLFYTLLILSLFLTRIPLIGKYFRSINTLVHEAGHVFVTLLVSGEVIAVNLFADNSGTTITKAKNKFLQVLIAAAGYPLSAITGFILVVLLAKGIELYILFALVSLSLLLMVLSIRNTYGLFWAGTFSILNLVILYFNNSHIIHIAATFFTLIILTDSILSTIILFVLSIKTPKKAGDATNLYKFTKIPPVIWAIIFLVFNGYLLFVAAEKYFPPIRHLIELI